MIISKQFLVVLKIDRMSTIELGSTSGSENNQSTTADLQAKALYSDQDASPIKISNYISLLWYQLSRILWRQNSEPESEPTDSSNIPLDSMWEWMLSPQERILLDQIASKSVTINTELQMLRKTNSSFGAKMSIQSQVTEILFKLRDIDKNILVNSRIPRVDQTSLFRYIFSLHSSKWLSHLQARLSPEEAENIAENWEEKEYSKNILGQLLGKILDASVAASSKGLTGRILCDIIWRIHLSLSMTLVEFRNGNIVSPEESMHLLDCITPLIPDLLQSWISTWTALEKIQSKEGKLPSIWAQREEKEKQRLIDLKQEGRIDASFTMISSPEPSVEKEDFLSRKSTLANSLVFRVGSISRTNLETQSPRSDLDRSRLQLPRSDPDRSRLQLPSEKLNGKVAEKYNSSGRSSFLDSLPTISAITPESSVSTLDSVRIAEMNSLFGALKREVSLRKKKTISDAPKLNPETVMSLSGLFSSRFCMV